MKPMITIPLWKLEEIYEALRLTSNIHNCSKKETCFDRVVTKALTFTTELLNEAEKSEELTIELDKEIQTILDRLEDDLL